jgi:hypothetical protein
MNRLAATAALVLALFAFHAPQRPAECTWNNSPTQPADCPPCTPEHC